jgi:hypothetical protein
MFEVEKSTIVFAELLVGVDNELTVVIHRKRRTWKDLRDVVIQTVVVHDYPQKAVFSANNFIESFGPVIERTRCQGISIVDAVVILMKTPAEE